jgi:hypothetical protein
VQVLCGLRAAWGLYIALNFRTTAIIAGEKEVKRGKQRAGLLMLTGTASYTPCPALSPFACGAWAEYF